MKSHYIHRLIAQGEHQHLDFKFEIADARKIARTFVAFSNASGGKLLIGVNDNGTIAGIRSEEERFMADTVANTFSKPAIAFRLKDWTIAGKKILEIVIAEGGSKPYFAQDENGKWLAYVRSRDQNILANQVLINAWKRKNRPEGVYIHYTETEKTLLEYLESNPVISLTEFTKLAFISSHKAENILSNFIALDIIVPEISGDQVLYKLPNKPSGENL
jgi:predicted HTH transcriptional regulator